MASSFLKLREVARRTSLSSATIRRLIAKGEFPRPIKISAGRVAWPETVIDEWMSTVVLRQSGSREH
jgi:prophage regulatory protein